MDATEAIQKAKEYFSKFFADEKITEVGLEEIEFDDLRDCWQVTIGFSRQAFPMSRWYKVVTFQDSDGKFLSVKNREPTPV